jgi:hypothetical protein
VVKDRAKLRKTEEVETPSLLSIHSAGGIPPRTSSDNFNQLTHHHLTFPISSHQARNLLQSPQSHSEMAIKPITGVRSSQWPYASLKTNLRLCRCFEGESLSISVWLLVSQPVFKAFIHCILTSFVQVSVWLEDLPGGMVRRNAEQISLLFSILL